MAEKELICPNCGPGTKCHAKEGGGLVCETCGGTFRYEAGEAKLKDIGELERLTRDVEDLKDKLAGTPEAPADESPADTAERDPDAEDDEEEDL